jgi:hypothetical protein
MMKIQLRIVLISALALSLAYSGCYYDSEEGLYYENCDTIKVTYTKSIAPICAGYCNSCHFTNNPDNYIATDNYASVKKYIDQIIPSINHTGPPNLYMPKGGGSLSECDLVKFDIWKRKGMPE